MSFGYFSKALGWTNNDTDGSDTASFRRIRAPNDCVDFSLKNKVPLALVLIWGACATHAPWPYSAMGKARSKGLRKHGGQAPRSPRFLSTPRDKIPRPTAFGCVAARALFTGRPVIAHRW